MGKSKNYYQTGITLTRHRQYHLNKLRRFMRNRYSYEFVNEEQRKDPIIGKIPFRYLEKLVSLNGRGALYNHPTMGFAVYKCTMAGNLNIYGNPGNYFLYTANGGVSINVAANDPNLIILQDNFDGTSLDIACDYYADQMGKIRETIMTNVYGMRTPFVIRAKKEQVMPMRLALEAMNEMPEVILDDEITFENSQSIGTTEFKIPDNLKSLNDEFNVTFAMFKEDIGFSSQNIDKKERLVAAEAENDEDVLKAFDNEPYENRLLFIKAMKDQFDIDLKLIKANDHLYTEEKPTENTENE